MTTLAKNRQLAKEYSELKATLKPLEDRVKAIKGYFDTLTNKETTDFGTWIVEYRPRLSDKVDLDRLKAEHPEINLEDYTIKVETRAMYIKATGKETI